MTLFLDEQLMTSAFTIPIREGWVTPECDVEIVRDLDPAVVGRGDVALIEAVKAPALAETHVIDAGIGVVVEAVSPISMRTPVRPDGVEETPIRMLNSTRTAEVLLRALLKPYFGIIASRFLSDADEAGADDAQVVLLDELAGLQAPEFGFQEDLARAWFVLTGASVVHAVTAYGVEAIDHSAQERGVLVSLSEAFQERRRDIRRAMVGEEDVDRERLVSMTNAMRFALTPQDRQSLQNMLGRGTWGTTYPRNAPAYLDQVIDA